MERIRWTELAANGLLFSSSVPCSLLQFFSHHACLPLMPAVFWENESVLEAQSCLLLHFPFTDNLAPLCQFHPPLPLPLALPPLYPSLLYSLWLHIELPLLLSTQAKLTPMKHCQLPVSLHSQTMVVVQGWSFDALFWVWSTFLWCWLCVKSNSLFKILPYQARVFETPGKMWAAKLYI